MSYYIQNERIKEVPHAKYLGVTLRMAQGMQCLQAICNYMRKVKLKYQHVIDYYNDI